MIIIIIIVVIILVIILIIIIILITMTVIRITRSLHALGTAPLLASSEKVEHCAADT